jgi:hypothetical protein
MRRWMRLSEYHWLVVFALLAVCATLVAWISFGLINLAMANYSFVSRHGLVALREGGILQMLEIGGKGLIVLVAYLVFKACESELVHRWRDG